MAGDDSKAARHRPRSSSSAHIPLWSAYPACLHRGRSARSTTSRFGSVTCSTAISTRLQKVEGNVTFHTAMSTAFPQPAPGTAPSPGPMKVPDDKLRSLLGVTDVTFKRGQQRLAIIDKPLQG